MYFSPNFVLSYQRKTDLLERASGSLTVCCLNRWCVQDTPFSRPLNYLMVTNPYEHSGLFCKLLYLTVRKVTVKDFGKYQPKSAPSAKCIIVPTLLGPNTVGCPNCVPQTGDTQLCCPSECLWDIS